MKGGKGIAVEIRDSDTCPLRWGGGGGADGRLKPLLKV